MLKTGEKATLNYSKSQVIKAECTDPPGILLVHRLNPEREEGEKEEGGSHSSWVGVRLNKQRT